MAGDLVSVGFEDVFNTIGGSIGAFDFEYMMKDGLNDGHNDDLNDGWNDGLNDG